MRYQKRTTALKENQKSPQKTIESNTELKDSSAGFSKLNYPEESINTYGAGDESEWDCEIVIITHPTVLFPLQIFLQYFLCKKNKIVSK